MWLSTGDLGPSVNVGSPNITLNTSGAGSQPPAVATSGFDWTTIIKSPWLYAAVIIVLIVLFKRKK